MFGKKERLVKYPTPDGEIFLNEGAFKEIMRLTDELRDVKHEKALLETELKRIKPVLKDKRITPPVSKACDDCRFAVRSTWNRDVLGCRKDSLCEDFSPKKEDKDA